MNFYLSMIERSGYVAAMAGAARLNPWKPAVEYAYWDRGYSRGFREIKEAYKR